MEINRGFSGHLFSNAIVALSYKSFLSKDKHHMNPSSKKSAPIRLSTIRCRVSDFLSHLQRHGRLSANISRCKSLSLWLKTFYLFIPRVLHHRQKPAEGYEFSAITHRAIHLLTFPNMSSSDNESGANPVKESTCSVSRSVVQRTATIEVPADFPSLEDTLDLRLKYFSRRFRSHELPHTAVHLVDTSVYTEVNIQGLTSP